MSANEAVNTGNKCAHSATIAESISARKCYPRAASTFLTWGARAGTAPADLIFLTVEQQSSSTVRKRYREGLRPGLQCRSSTGRQKRRTKDCSSLALRLNSRTVRLL